MWRQVLRHHLALCSSAARRSAPAFFPLRCLALCLTRERTCRLYAMPTITPTPLPPALPFQSCVGFLAFWTGACWFSYSAGLLWAFRTGMLQP